MLAFESAGHSALAQLLI